MNERERVEHRRNNIIILIAFAAVPAIYALVLLVTLAARHWKLFALLAVVSCAGCRLDEMRSTQLPPPARSEDAAGRALQKQFEGM